MNDIAELISNKPKNAIIADIIREQILSGALSAGTRLLSDDNFASKYGINKRTVASGMNSLVAEGLLERISGRGTFVALRNIKSHKNSTIIVVYNADSNFENPTNYIIEGVVSYAENKNLKILTINLPIFLSFSSNDIKKYVKANNVIGIIAPMNGFLGDEAVLDEFRNASVPVVITHGEMEDAEVTGFATIALNKKEGWEVAVSYLAECGHKKICIIGQNENHRFRGYDKQGCMALLKKYGAEPIESLIVDIEFDKELVKRTVREIFTGDIKPTAVLCYSDFYAIYVYESLKEMNLRIPEDVAVMGVCGYPDAELLSPPLSTVDYEYSKISEMAVEMLLEPNKWFSNCKGKLRKKPFKIRKRKSTDKKLIN